MQIADTAVVDDDDDDDNLTDKQRGRIQLAKAEALGLTEDDLVEVALIKRQREAANATNQKETRKRTFRPTADDYAGGTNMMIQTWILKVGTKSAHANHHQK